MERYTAKDLMKLVHLTPTGMDALKCLVEIDIIGRDENAIIDAAIVEYWRKAEEKMLDIDWDTLLDEPDEDVDEDLVDIDWDEVLDPWTFGGM